MALGLDPGRATLFVQSDVPEVAQLCWLLLTGAPMGLLERCHAYKDKKARGLTADAGLFAYPVLMAADILLYDSDLVPVGEDQTQHIEVARDLAASFNHEFGETFVLPKAKVLDSSACVPGTDGEKMSKSYGNTLAVFEEPKALRKQIMRIVTDSRPMEQPKEPDHDHLFQLYSLFADAAQREAMAATYRRGGFGYGEVKKALAERAENYFAEARRRREELVAQPEKVREILGDGAATARRKAAEVLLRAERACGIKTSAHSNAAARHENQHPVNRMTHEPESIPQKREVLTGGRFRLLAFVLWMPAAAGLGAVAAWLAIEGQFTSPPCCCSRFSSAVGVGAAECRPHADRADGQPPDGHPGRAALGGRGRRRPALSRLSVRGRPRSTAVGCASAALRRCRWCARWSCRRKVSPNTCGSRPTAAGRSPPRGR